MLHEELMRFELILILGTAFISAFRISTGMRLGKNYLKDSLKSVKNKL